ncbi:MAG: ABC transporter permease [Dehalococcoidales bacterium]|nr:ABC transporter permease [Dehalococcoidales bacterium]
MKNLKHVWFIALKDLRLFVTDRLAMGMFILFPFLFIVMFNLLLGNIGSDDEVLELHLVTLEQSGISRQIIESMETKDRDAVQPGETVIIWDKDYNQAKADVEAGNIEGFLAFPADFTQAMLMGYDTQLEIVADAEASNTRMALNGLAEGIISQTGAQRVQINALIALMVQQEMITGQGNTEGIQSAMEQMFRGQSEEDSRPSLIAYQTEDVGEVKPTNPSSYVVPGYLVMFVFFASAISAEAIVRERRNHTLERLLASSVRKESLLGGIYLGNTLKGLLQIAIFWIFGILVFKVDIGVAPWAVILISVLMVLMSAAFAVMLATLVKTERSASALAVLVSLLLAPLGGCWWPLFIEPRWMQFIARITPHGWANAGFNKLLVFGASGSSVTWEMVALALFAAAFMIIAIINFRTSSDAT